MFLGLLVVNRLSQERIADDLNRTEMRMRSLVDILQHPFKSVQEILDRTLDEAIHQTESKIGCLYLYSEEKNEFTLNTWSEDEFYESKYTPRTCHQFQEIDIWVETVRQRKSIIHNDLQNPSLIKKGLSTENVGLFRLMTLPIFSAGRIVAVVGVANKPTDYDDADILQLTLLINGVWESNRAKTKPKSLYVRAREHYRMLFDSIDEGFCIVEVIFDEHKKPLDYRFLETNPSFEKQTGLINAQGKRMRELAPLHEEYWFKTYGKVALTGNSIRFQNRAEQLQRWYNVYAFRYGNPENRQVAILFNDITERKQVEAARAEADMLLRMVLSNAPITIFAMDSQGVFTLSEGKGLDHVGLKPGENVGVSALDLYNSMLYTEYSGKVITGKEVIQRILAGESVNAINEFRGVFFDNHIGPIRDVDGNLVGIVGVATDVTERKQAEEKTAKFTRPTTADHIAIR